VRSFIFLMPNTLKILSTHLPNGLRLAWKH